MVSFYFKECIVMQDISMPWIILMCIWVLLCGIYAAYQISKDNKKENR